MARAENLSRKNARQGFSLIELVIVVVIIGIIAAIAIPRMSRGTQGAADSALRGDLAVLCNAVDLYHTEHQAYPGTGTFTTSAHVVRQLTKYTDVEGRSNADGTKDASATPPIIYGPYLRKIPKLPVGSSRGNDQILLTSGPASTPDTTNKEGWLYNSSNGDVIANLPNTETDGKDAYNSY